MGAGGIKLLAGPLAAGNTASGYNFRMYLPDGTGSALSSDDAPRAARNAAASNAQEQYFAVYAWPQSTETGRKMFVLTQDGQVRSLPWDGSEPAWDAALGNGWGYLQLSGTLGGGKLSAKLREQIALTVAQANGCAYCLAAHCAIGGMVGLSKEQLHDSRLGIGTDSHAHAVLSLARAIVDERGRVSDEELAAARNAGLDDAEIAEVVANVALNVFTNYFNNLAGTTIDFPVASPLETPSAEACSTGTCSH